MNLKQHTLINPIWTTCEHNNNNNNSCPKHSVAGGFWIYWEILWVSLPWNFKYEAFLLDLIVLEFFCVSNKLTIP